MSLGVALVVFVPVIGTLGVLPEGASWIGSEGTVTSMANTTYWSAYSAVGSAFPVALIIVGAVLLVLAVLSLGVATKIMS